MGVLKIPLDINIPMEKQSPMGINKKCSMGIGHILMGFKNSCIPWEKIIPWENLWCGV